MKNLWTSIHVKNMEESLAFYTTALKMTISSRISPMEGMEIVFLGDGETKLELMYNTHIKDISYGNHVSTGFLIDSVDDYMTYLKEQNIEVVDGPYAPGPHVKFFFVEDPNGYRIQLVEQK